MKSFLAFLFVQYTLDNAHIVFSFLYSGSGAKSLEKILVVAYAMKAMGLNRLADVAAHIFKSKTGLQVDWITFPDGNEIPPEMEVAEAAEVKVEQVVKVEKVIVKNEA